MKNFFPQYIKLNQFTLKWISLCLPDPLLEDLLRAEEALLELDEPMKALPNLGEDEPGEEQLVTREGGWEDLSKDLKQKSYV